MDRRTGIRLTIAAGLAIGLSFGVAPQLVSGSTGGGAPVPAAPARIAAVGDQVWPIDLHAATPAPSIASTPETETPDVPVTTPPAPAPEPPVATTAPVTAAPAPTPVVEETMTNAGTIHVYVAAAEGASRSVSLKTADGALVGGPAPVDGSRITFSDVSDGTYDLFVEHTADGGGTFLTRTTLVVSGNEVAVSCDAHSLDCTVA